MLDMAFADLKNDYVFRRIFATHPDYASFGQPDTPNATDKTITVTLTDGRKLVKEVEFPRGHAGNRIA